MTPVTDRRPAWSYNLRPCVRDVRAYARRLRYGAEPTANEAFVARVVSYELACAAGDLEAWEELGRVDAPECSGISVGRAYRHRADVALYCREGPLPEGCFERYQAGWLEALDDKARTATGADAGERGAKSVGRGAEMR